MRKLIFLACLVAGCAGESTPELPDDEQPSGDPDQDTAAASLATDRGITLDEAQQRMAWQDKLDDLEDALKAQLGDSFGALYVDPEKGDRVQVAMTATATAADVMAIAQQLGVDAGVDVTRVEHSGAELQELADKITAELGNTGVAAVDPVANVVTITQLTSDRTAVARALNAYGAAVREGHAIEMEPMAGTTQFNPPSRGGMLIETTGGVWCTSGFFAHGKSSAHLPYWLLAGHCIPDQDGATWYAKFANGTFHELISGLTFQFGGAGDWAIGHAVYNNVWKGKPWVVVQKGASTSYVPRYTIKANGMSRVGTRVCHSGAAIGTTCGTITGVDKIIIYIGTGRAAVGEVTTNFCTKAGDSGGPVFAAHKAFGILTAGTGKSPHCSGAYEPIQRVEKFLHVTVDHCIGSGATTPAADECCSLGADHSRSNQFLTCE